MLLNSEWVIRIVKVVANVTSIKEFSSSSQANVLGGTHLATFLPRSTYPQKERDQYPVVSGETRDAWSSRSLESRVAWSALSQILD